MSDRSISGWRWVCYAVSEGPKVEEMEGVGEPRCDSPFYQERELGTLSSPSLPSVIHIESCSNLISEPGESSLGTKRLRWWMMSGHYKVQEPTGWTYS